MTTRLRGIVCALPHFVSPEPFDLRGEAVLTPEQERIYGVAVAHDVVAGSAICPPSFPAVIALDVPVDPGSESSWRPTTCHTRHTDYIYAPPQTVHFPSRHLRRPFRLGLNTGSTWKPCRDHFSEDPDDVQPLRFFCLSDPYAFWGWRPGASTSSARPRTAPCSCSAPTASGAICSRASCMVPASRSPSACSASP
jgi:peptide/nickel transport system permease protein